MTGAATFSDTFSVHTPPSLELLAGAFNAASNGFLLVDGQGRVVAANTELELMFGYPADSLAGQPMEVLLPMAMRQAHVAMRQEFLAHPERRAMGAGRLLYARRANGQEFPVEIGLNPLVGPWGTFVLASVVDISERMALEWAFRGVFDACPCGMVIVDDDGRIMMANPALAQSLGYTSAALIDQPLDTLLPQRYKAAHGDPMKGYLRTGDARMMGRGRDLTAQHRDGTELPVEIGLRRVPWKGQTVTLAAVSDISQRKRLELELRQANVNLEEFTYAASHDLRSPLRGIADLVEWIQSDLGDEVPPEVAKNLGRVATRISRMEGLIADLLSYARAGRAETLLSAVDIDALVRGVLEIQPVPPEFAVETLLNAAPFRAAKTPLEAVLRNLIGNAVKHHDGPRGHIRIEAVERGGECEISITDDGPGIPGDSKEKIFDLFQTLTTNRRGDSGIGLALTKRAIEAHGGRIEVISPVANDRGSCFRFWWPRFPRRTNEEV